MAITFSKDIAEDKLLYAFNNNVVRFSSDNTVQARYCDVSGIGIDVRLYPLPNGSFYFNFREYAGAVVNTKAFVDDLVTNLTAADADTFTYDVTDGALISGEITFEITFTDESTETITRNLSFLAGVVQLENFKRQEIPSNGSYMVLSPVQSRSSNTVNMTYWEGYPFELSFYTSFPESAFTLKNIANGLDYEFTAKGPVTSLYLSDGRTDVALEDFLPLVIGMNELHIIKEDVDQGLNININKADAECGVYVKWLNHLGRWNYRLLNHRSFRDRTSKYGEELESDHDNIEDTFAPTTQTGKVSADVLKCNTGKLTPEEKEVLLGILDSPKIYYFTGDRYSRSELSDWMEVTLKTTTLRTDDSNRNTFDYKLDFDLPTRYAQSL